MDTPDSSIQSMMHEERLFVPPEALKSGAHIKSHEEYLKLHQESLKDPEGFWGAQAEKLLTWRKKWDTVLEWKSPFA